MADMFWDVNGDDGPVLSGGSPESRMSELEGRIDRLSMICCAMWTVLQAHTDVTDADLAQMVQELDLSDGCLDGKANVRQVSPCAACNRPVANRHARCLYCGAPRRARGPFDAVL